MLRRNIPAASRPLDDGIAIAPEGFAYSHRHTLWLIFTLAAGGLLCTACCSIHRLPPTDLLTPGWSIQQGQAVWKPTRTKPELAGELTVATNSTGDYFVQFSKLPFTLATAQRIGGQWQVEFGPGDVTLRGRGRPPSRFAWFELPRALARGTADSPWQFEEKGCNTWLLRNYQTGETLQGYLLP